MMRFTTKFFILSVLALSSQQALATQPAPDVIARAAASVVCLFDSPSMEGGGSGVIIDPAGYGLTNFHVIASMLQNDRRGFGGMSDGLLYPVEVIGLDPGGDVALFRIHGADRFPASPLGDSDNLRTGQVVMAMGNPFVLAEDFEPTLTMGRISGINRYQEGASGGNFLEYADCIQVATSINPGNSGGPLFDASGNVIGINGRASFRTEDMSGRGRVNVGLGYAISINQIKRFLPCLRRGELCLHGTLSMTVRQAGQRVIVDAIQEAGPAAEAKIAIGDELLSIDDRPMPNPNAFINYLTTLPADHPVTVTLKREEREFSVMARLEPLRLRDMPPWIPDPRHENHPPLELLQPYDSRGEEIPAESHQMNASSVKLFGAKIGSAVGYGSGVIVSADGLLLTANTPMLDGRTIQVHLADGRETTAEVVRRDNRRQIALLQIELDDVPFAKLSAAGRLTPGQSVIAAGNPFKVANGSEPVTLMFGHYSGTTRLDARLRRQDFSYRGPVLITDMVLSTPGFAGGGLFEPTGVLVGLIGPPVQSNRTNTWLSYAIPAAELSAFIAGEEDEVVTLTSSHGRVLLGLTLFDVGGRTQPAYIERVHLSGPARAAGLRANDLILAIDGQTVETCYDFDQIISELPPNLPIMLVYKRGDQVRTVQLRLAEVGS